MTEITFKQFAKFAKRLNYSQEDLVSLFRGKIEEPHDFFGRVLSCRYRNEDRSNVVIPFRSVIEFYEQNQI